MPTKYIEKIGGSAAARHFTGQHAGIGVDADTGDLKFNASGTIQTVSYVGKPAPVATVAATKTVTAAESGSTFFLNHATEFVTTLPAPAAGLHYRFVCANAPETASYTIVTASSANLFAGSVSTAQDAGGTSASDDDGDTITFVDSKAVVGDWVEVVSDGTTWFVSGNCKVFDGITITKVS